MLFLLQPSSENVICVIWRKTKFVIYFFMCSVSLVEQINLSPCVITPFDLVFHSSLVSSLIFYAIGI